MQDFKKYENLIPGKDVLRRRLMAQMEVDVAEEHWIWIGEWTEEGYGLMDLLAKPVHIQLPTHVVAAHVWLNLELFTQRQVLQICGQPACFYPKHLQIGRKRILEFSGIQRRNTVRGELAPNSKYSIEQAVAVRDALRLKQKTKDTIKGIADKLGVTADFVTRIKNKTAWEFIWNDKFNMREEKKKIADGLKKRGDVNISEEE